MEGGKDDRTATKTRLRVVSEHKLRPTNRRTHAQERGRERERESEGGREGE
jgi:hypothetical protein